MKIIDLNEKYLNDYLTCLEDWSEEIKEGCPRKAFWYEKMKARGLKVKLALDENDKAGGMIQYAPIENTFVDGQGLYFIYCIWIHGHKKGRGNYQKRGMGSALLKAAEEDAKVNNAKGIACWGVSLPFWMKASWFRKYGYKPVDKQSIMLLMFKKFSNDAVVPKWIREKRKPEKTQGKITITAFIHGWCPFLNITYERVKKVAKEFDNKIIFNEIDTLEKNNLVEHGIPEAIFIDDREIKTIPPLSNEKIRKLIKRKADKLE